MHKPLCFVLMPFGEKPDVSGHVFMFDDIYKTLIEPAIIQADLESLRADEEMGGGIIHKPMLERLILCEFAVADLTTANANVFYELGLRHAIRPWSTILIYAEGARLPFDVTPLRAFSYKVDSAGLPSNKNEDLKGLIEKLIHAKAESGRHEKGGFTDSPLYQLVEDYPNIDHTKTDVFRDRVSYSKEKKREIASVRNSDSLSIDQKADEIRVIEAKSGKIDNLESGVIIDLLLSYRAVKSWKDMIRLASAMPKFLAETVLVQEQLALALNRNGESHEAQRVLEELLSRRGKSSETLGILGRVFKDRWEKAVAEKKEMLAEGLLDKAIDAYVKGFEADWRDAYPGVNAVTLMSLRSKIDPRFNKIFPVVRYSVEQRLSNGLPDYWDYATLLELSILDGDKEQAHMYARKSLANVREVWEPETTARNLRLIINSKFNRNEEVKWIEEIEDSLINFSKA